MNQTLSFLFRYILLGLIAAIAVIEFYPAFIKTPPPAIKVQAAPDRPHGLTASGAVSYADAVSRAQPAVVNIHTAKVVTREQHPILDDPLFQQFFGERYRSIPRRRLETSLGSGVVISSQGYVVTNHHVIKGADAIRVSLADGRILPALIVGQDPDTDLAVLKVPEEKLTAITLGNSDQLRVGDVALAIGNPFGVGQTVTMGIVSATGRNKIGINTFEDYIQTDAAINPGNSGGALVNALGELIGINTAIFSKSGGSQGIGFAVPSNTTLSVLTDIITHGRVIRGWLGIEAKDVNRQIASSLNLDSLRGILVSSVYRRSPAFESGVRPGDIIYRIGDHQVDTADEALRLISRMEPGEKLLIQGQRNNEEFHTLAEVIERPDSVEDSQ